MSEPQQFHRLTLAITRQMYWEQAPETYSRDLGYFLRLLLSAGGEAAFRLENPREGVSSDWCRADEAKQLAEDEVSGYLLSLARGAGPRDGRPLNQMDRARCRVFFDFACLLAAMRQAPPTTARNPLTPEDLEAAFRPYTEAGGQLYFNFSVEFSLADETLVFTPLLLLRNYRPSLAFAPPHPTPGEARPALPQSLEGALHVLGELFWRQAETAFSQLRSGFLPFATLQVAGMDAEPSPFYFLEPASPPARPEEYFQGAWAQTTHHLVRELLGTHDPLSHDLSGALLEGELFTLRREVRVPGESFSRRYLVLLCPDEGGQRNTERKIRHIADKLSYIDFSADRAHRELNKDYRASLTKLLSWEEFVNSASAIVADWLKQLAGLPPTFRGRAYEQIGFLQQRLLHLSPDMTRHTEEALGYPGRLDVARDNTLDFIALTLTLRAVPGPRSLADALADTYPYNYLKEPLAQVAKKASRLRGLFERVLKGMSDLLEQEKREAAERQAASSLRLTFAAAALTVATVLPALVDIKFSPEDLPRYHAWLIGFRGVVLAALAVALGAVALPTLAQLASFLWQGGWSSNLLRGLGYVNHLDRLIRDAQQEENWEPLVQIDAEACDLLVRLESVVGPEPARHSEDPPSRAFRRHFRAWASAYTRDIARRTMQLLLFSTWRYDWPSPCLLPRTLAVLHSRPGLFGFLPDGEFQRVLGIWGHDEKEIERISHFCRENSHLPLTGFLRELDKRGLTAHKLPAPA